MLAMMNKKLLECGEKLRKLVSDVQGAPYPASVNNELYSIWYEHIQRDALEAFEYLDENFPKDDDADVKDTMRKAF